MIVGLLLALTSAALINIGFLLQHRGLRHRRGGTALAELKRALADRVWLSGQALGWVGFATQIAAVAIAPLSLVQAFAAGGVALSVPIAAGMFDQRITRTQAAAVIVVAAGLATLPIGFSSARDRLDGGALALVMAAGTVAGVAVARPAAGWSRAIAAGIFYGIADAGIKAVSLGLRHHGAAALVSVWTAVAAVGTFAGFLSFQSALREDRPVAAISLMNGLAALVALACGLAAFGESLGIGAGATAGHALAILVVLCGVPVLVDAPLAVPGRQLEKRRR